jgi:hypothetical protein
MRCGAGSASALSMMRMAIQAGSRALVVEA